MNIGTIYTPAQAEAARIVNRIHDHPAEAKRRWPDFHFEVKQEGRTAFLYAYWTRDGKKRGFKDPLPPRHRPDDVRNSLERAAAAAIFKAEHDRLTGAGA